MNDNTKWQLSKFLMNSVPTKINNFLLCCGIGQTADIQMLSDGLKVTLPVIQNKVNINLFKLDDKLLSSVIESASNCRRLQLFNCKIGITKNFYVNHKIEFKIKELDMRLTCISNVDEKLDLK